MILKVENIAKAYRNNKVLKNISFKMESGSLIGIVGENGSGKSTLLKIIVGALKSDKGEIFMNGNFGYCPQKTLLFSQLTVDENINYFASAYGINNALKKTNSESLMEFFNFSKFRQMKVSTLSGGTQQKLNLSLALLHKPELLILDEPYSGFDWHTYIQFWELTKKLQKENCSILVVTHLLTEKEKFDRIYNLEEGELKCE